MTGAIPGLHDIHLPAAPGWWPPAPGWWVLAGLLATATAWLVRRLLRSRCRRLREREQARRIARALAEYDLAIGSAQGATGRIAAASLQLRRAAQWRDPAAALLEGDAWLRYLDGDDPSKSFSMGQGALLRDSGFRRSLDADIAGTLALARTRFASLLHPAPMARDPVAYAPAEHDHA